MYRVQKVSGKVYAVEIKLYDDIEDITDMVESTGAIVLCEDLDKARTLYNEDDIIVVEADDE